MLDPIQRSVRDLARGRRVRVSGFSGSGKSLLARVLADDAARRGLSCLLVGDSPLLDVPTGPMPSAPRLHPTLSARATTPVASEAPAQALPDDAAALRATLDPESARLAVLLRQRAALLMERHGLSADEVEASVRVTVPDTRILGLLRVAAMDARDVAGVTWEPDEPERTLGEVAETVDGSRPPPNQGYGALVLDRNPGAVDAYLASLVGSVPVEIAERPDLDALRRALEPWAWRSTLRTVGDAHDWALTTGRLFRSVADHLEGHGDFSLALADGAAAPDVVRTLRVWQSRFPDVSWTQAVETCRMAAATHERQSAAVEPYLGAHAGRALDSLHGRTASLPGLGGAPVSVGVLAQRLRSAHFAARRLQTALAELSDSLPARTWQEVLARPLSELVATADVASVDSERLDAARTLREIRAAYAATGFGDILDPAGGPPQGAVPGLDATPPRRLTRPDPTFLDILMPPPQAVGAPDPRPDRITRLREGDDLTGLAAEYDVVVIDDERSTSDALMAAVNDLSSMTHSVGVEPGEFDHFALAFPHRQRDLVLANVATGREASPFWLGSPKGAGIIVRTLSLEEAPDLNLASARLREALSKAGYDAGAHPPAEGRASCDIAVVAGEHVGADEVRAACGQARDGVVVLCRTCDWEPGPMMLDDDDAGLRREGWTLVANVAEGRIFTNQGKSAVLVREPAWNDLAVENVAERVNRLRDLGWNPVVDWIGRPRDPADLAKLLAASAVSPDPRMILIMKGHPLGQTGADRAQ